MGSAQSASGTQGTSTESTGVSTGQTTNSTQTTQSIGNTTPTVVVGGSGEKTSPTIGVSGASATAGGGETLAATGAPIAGGLVGGLLFLLGALGLRNRRR